jgi:mycoredoxin
VALLTVRNVWIVGLVNLAMVTRDSAPVTMYTTPWCGYCVRLKAQLRRAGVSYSEVDIEQQPEAAALVERVNCGNQTVPTLVFADGSALTNPSLVQVTRKLEELQAAA